MILDRIGRESRTEKMPLEQRASGREGQTCGSLEGKSIPCKCYYSPEVGMSLVCSGSGKEVSGPGEEEAARVMGHEVRMTLVARSCRDIVRILPFTLSEVGKYWSSITRLVKYRAPCKF